jgi:hypothetical protein
MRRIIGVTVCLAALLTASAVVSTAAWAKKKAGLPYFVHKGGQGFNEEAKVEGKLNRFFVATKQDVLSILCSTDLDLGIGPEWKSRVKLTFHDCEVSTNGVKNPKCEVEPVEMNLWGQLSYDGAKGTMDVLYSGIGKKFEYKEKAERENLANDLADIDVIGAECTGVVDKKPNHPLSGTYRLLGSILTGVIPRGVEQEILTFASNPKANPAKFENPEQGNKKESAGVVSFIPPKESGLKEEPKTGVEVNLEERLIEQKLPNGELITAGEPFGTSE